jgi:hypothetical protein
MSEIFEIVLLLGLPASGKSEIRRLLANVDEYGLKKDFHIGDTIHMDDFPYVYLMRKIDSVLEKNGFKRIFAESEELPFKDPRDWGTLIHLLNEDYFDLVSKNVVKVKSYTKEFLKRIDASGGKVGIPNRLTILKPNVLERIEEVLEDETRKMFEEKYASYPESLHGKTIIIEFARGGAKGSALPLKPPFGYQYSLSQLADEILSKSVILYNWVTPEESRRKNSDRADPNNPGSILHHGVPMEVMLKEYGTDDIEWLAKNSDVEGTVLVRKGLTTFYVPIASFDNRTDKTTFLRQDLKLWDKEKVKAIRDAIKSATDRLYMLVNKNKI